MNYKIYGNGAKLILKNLSFGNLIGKAYLSPASFIQLPGHTGLILKEGLANKDPEFQKTGAFLFKREKIDFTDHFMDLSRRIKKQGKDATDFKFFLLLNREIEIEFLIKEIGNTSFIGSSTIFDATEKKLLATGTHTTVPVNKFTGVKKMVPEEYKKLVKGRINSSAGLNQSINIPNRRSDYHHSIKLGILNSGIIGYTPHDQYPTFCLDSLAAFMHQKGIPHMTGTIWNYCVRSCDSLYLIPSEPGDDLDINVWKERENGLRFYFRIKKKEKSVCEAVVEMVPNEE